MGLAVLYYYRRPVITGGPARPPAHSRGRLEPGPERKATRRKARAQIESMHERYRRVCVNVAERLDEMPSPENLAAKTAPLDEKSLLMQRREDSNLRQLWRLTNLLLRLRNGGPTLRDVKNEATSGDVYENKGEHDKMSGENDDFLQENAATEG